MTSQDLVAMPSTRRSFLYSLGASLGSVAFSDLLAQEAAGPLAVKQPHHAAKAKACIFLVMEGGPSHIDTFDPKPKLEQLHMQQFERAGEEFSPMSSGVRYYVQSPYKSRKVGQAGMDMCEHFVHLPEVADELCFYRGCQSESVDPPNGAVPHQYRQQVRRGPRCWLVGHLRARQREPEPSGLHRFGRGRFPAGRIGQLDERLPARLLPRHPVASGGIADSGHPSAIVEDPGAPAQEPRPARRSQSIAPSEASES